MSKKVLTEVKCSYATFSGNVSDINVKTDYVPDSSDYDKLKDKITGLENKIETLEGQVANLQHFVKEFSCSIEHLTSESLSDVRSILVENLKQVKELVNS
jgi:peptidoglycan hydrolase CwlO-like protein